ncbi:MAG: chaperonin GroEL [Chloroflexi bacterium]|nr:chaperonin GroEL [Chloroflexota bacterium]
MSTTSRRDRLAIRREAYDDFVMLGPEARMALKRGFDTMANLLKITLGPKARTIAVAKMFTSGLPEILDDGATIARRIVELPGRYENMGAMICRQLSWRAGEEAGDGTTTAAVIGQALLDEATRYVAAGGNVMMLKRGMEKALPVLEQALKVQAVSITSWEDVAKVAEAASGDPYVGQVIGAMYEAVGKEGVLHAEDSAQTAIVWTWVDGIEWSKGYVSPHMVTDQQRMEAALENPLILVTDRNIDKAEQLVPLLEKLHQAGIKNLFILANDVSGDAIGLLVVNKERGIINAVACNAPSAGDRRVRITEDFAISVGARMVSEEQGDLIEEASLYDLGRATKVVVTRDYFRVFGPAGDPAAIKARADKIRREVDLEEYDHEKERVFERLGKLQSKIATIWVGAASESEQKEKRLKVDDAIWAVRAAIANGVVPGGGLAYLRCIPALQKLVNTLEGDERFGVEVLMRTLEAPIRTLTENGGYHAPAILDQLSRMEDGIGFDVVTGEFTNLFDRGILDAYNVSWSALRSGISGALMALTCEALILPKKPETVLKP